MAQYVIGSARGGAYPEESQPKRSITRMDGLPIDQSSAVNGRVLHIGARVGTAHVSSVNSVHAGVAIWEVPERNKPSREKSVGERKESAIDARVVGTCPHSDTTTIKTVECTVGARVCYADVRAGSPHVRKILSTPSGRP